MIGVSPEAQWLVERSEVSGYAAIVILALFGYWLVTWLYVLAFPPEPRGRRTLLVAVAEAEGKKEVGANFKYV